MATVHGFFLVSCPCRGSNEAVRNPVASATALTEQGVGEFFSFLKTGFYQHGISLRDLH